ncbi:LysR family transcriptional regulator [Planotetraspora thailandica]|uniref:LysR family transcriptional regulator n=1 Tax=Planotetraspora thailandica TaxID=487172 RepID=A0A8J3Y0W8_9ACTN|nr:LysR family transcriptional regulator [Planotetraspora thailandica]GII58790.1 LysR family transcriptional regulator [Planotetraspora thailandica]
MDQLDLNLLIALDALLEENSVTAAAGRLHLSVPAMSRTLGRIRKTLGDPVLVRAGREMVPTPRALALRSRVHAVVEEAQALFSREAVPDPGALNRSFVLLAHDEIVHGVGPRLLARVREEAPGVALRFMAEAPTETAGLRHGDVALEIGEIGDAPPETTVEPLMRDRLVAVVRPGHALADGRMTARRFAAARHLSVSRRGRLEGPVDTALAARGLTRVVAASVPTFAAALFVVLGTDLVGMVPETLCRGSVAALGLTAFDIPADVPDIQISQAWHPRYDRDGAHAWLRERVREAVTQTRDGR